MVLASKLCSSSGPFLVFAALGAAGCAPEEELIDGVFTPAEWEKVKILSPLPELPENPTNRFADDPGAAAFGQLIGVWRTKGLRQIAETAPYMHSGQFATLAEVVDFYDQGGHDVGLIGVKDAVLQPLQLSAGEKADLVEFLRSLTGEEVDPELLRDPAG